MPGLKQHCIPHFLPRGFGSSRSSKNIQVTVYSRTHGIYRAATQGVGAQREFYPNADLRGASPPAADATALLRA